MDRRNLLALMLAGTGSLVASGAGRAEAVRADWQRDWPRTDFSRATVALDEIISGGVPRDGIPALVDPAMIAAADEARLGEREPVMTLEIAGHAARAYPIRYLTWHEIVNDRIGDLPVAVTFCPLCNSGLVFDRRLDAQTLEFGVSGLLRHSDLIMYDRQSFTWWQQFTGAGIVGTHAGRRLAQVVAWTESWQTFAERNPGGLVMDEPAAHARPYGRNPYVGYDTSRPFLYRGENPPHGIDPVARVVRVGKRAWPLERIAALGEIEEAGLRLSWTGGMASALDAARIPEGRDVGQIRVRDAATGADVLHEVVFAFAFHAFEPAGVWMIGP